MEYVIILFSAFILPFIVGYVYGKDGIDPNTGEGKIYYSKGDSK